MLNNGRGIFDDPKSVVVLVKRGFCMEILDLVEEKLKNFRDSLSQGFAAACARRNNNTSTRWRVVHFRHPVHKRQSHLRDSQL